jgi:hypothetical protein
MDIAMLYDRNDIVASLRNNLLRNDHTAIPAALNFFTLPEPGTAKRAHCRHTPHIVTI